MLFQILKESFSSLGVGVVDFLSRLLLALAVFALGGVIAYTFGRLATQLTEALKIDKFLKKIGIEEPLSRAHLRLNSGVFVGALVKWFFVIVFLMASIEILGLDQLNIFLRDVVLSYLPNVILAALMLLVTAVLAEFLKKTVMGGAKAANLPSAAFLGGVTKWAIWVFGILTVLYQLGIAGALVQTLFTGFIAMMAIAGGLAFGLGGKDTAADFLAKLKKDISE